MSLQHILTAARRGAEAYQQVHAMERAAGYDRVKIASALWSGFRERSFDVLAGRAFWGPMAAEPSTYSASDVVSLIQALAAQPGLGRRDWFGAIDGWDPAFDAMVDAAPEALRALADSELAEPVAGGVLLARARRGLVPPAAVPAALLRRAALAEARGWGVRDRSSQGLDRVWPGDRFGAAVISAALEDPSRIVQLSVVLKHAAFATPLQLLQLTLSRTSDVELIPWFARIVDGAAEVGPEALDAAERALKRPAYEQRALPNAAVLLVLDRLAEARGEVLDPRFDPLLPEALQGHGDDSTYVTWMRGLLRRLPLERRAAVVVMHDHRPAWPYLDLAPTPEVLAAAARAVGRLDQDASATAALTAAFSALGEPGAAALLAALSAEDPEREQTHVLLELLGEHPIPEAIPALVEAAADPHERVRQAAHDALARFTLAGLDAAVLEALGAALGARKRATRLSAALTLADLPRTPATRALAQSALAEARDELVAAALRPVAEAPGAAGLAAWMELAPRKLTPICRAFAQALEDRSDGWRARLDLAPEDLLAGVVLWLEGHLASALSFYRWDRVLGVLERVRGTAMEPVAPWALGSVLGDCGQDRVAEAYVAQLGAAFGEAAIAPVLYALATPPQHRAPLYDWLLSQHTETLPGPVLEVFLKALRDPSPAVRALAARGVARTPEARPRLSSPSEAREAPPAEPTPSPRSSEDERAEQDLSTFGFDARAQRSVTLGAHRLRLELGPRGDVSVYDEAGRARARLPSPRKGEDPAEAREARQRIGALRREVQTAFDAQRRRLERAMRTGRGWTPDRFRALFLNHPLLYPLARRLLFLGRGPEGQASLFFVAEDGSPTGGDLIPINIEIFNIIQIPPGATLHPADRASWTVFFAEAGLEQPFAQL